MKRIFIDTNVVLDFILCRDGEQEAMDIFQLGEDGKVSLFVSYLTMANYTTANYGSPKYS